MPHFRGSSKFESLTLSHHFRFNVTCECNKEEINDDEVGTFFERWASATRKSAGYSRGSAQRPNVLFHTCEHGTHETVTAGEYGTHTTVTASERGIHKTVTARFRPWPSGKRPEIAAPHLRTRNT